MSGALVRVQSTVTADTEDRRRLWDRSEAGRGRCEQCGQLKGIGTKGKNKLCVDCARERRQARRQQIADMWAKGLTRPQIAEALGTTEGSIGATIAQMRRAGWDLPRRNQYSEESLRICVESGRKARAA